MTDPIKIPMDKSIKPDPALLQCIKDAGLDHIEDVSFEHFKNKAIDLMSKSSDAYYNGNTDECEKLARQANHVLRQARIFNTHYGL